MSNININKNKCKFEEIYNNLIELQEYFLQINNIIYKFCIYQRKNDIIVKCKNYEIRFNCNDLSLLTKSIFNSISDAYEFIINLFEDNNVKIKNVKRNREIILLCKIFIYNKEKDIELFLKYDKSKSDYIIKQINDNYYKLKEEIDNLNGEANSLKKEMNEPKACINKSCLGNTLMPNDCEIENYENPIDIQFLNNIVNDSDTKYILENTFSVFKSIDNLLYLIYTNKNKSIITYNLIDHKKIKEIKDAHNEYISNFRHFLDKINRKDLIISISCKDNNIKLWNVYNLELIKNIENVNKEGELDSACFLTDNNRNYIISCNDIEDKKFSEPIKVFDFNGQKTKEINNSNERSFFIDSYYDKKNNKNYIITSNKGYAKSYDFQENQIYHLYQDTDNRGHFSLIIYNNKNIVKLIESVCDGNIRVWNFHTGKLLQKINVSNFRLYGLCLWNEDYIFVGCEDKSIKLIEVKTGKIVKILNDHNQDVVTIRKIYIPQYGECLLSQGWNEETIKIWCNPINQN